MHSCGSRVFIPALVLWVSVASACSHDTTSDADTASDVTPDVAPPDDAEFGDLAVDVDPVDVAPDGPADDDTTPPDTTVLPDVVDDVVDVAEDTLEPDTLTTTDIAEVADDIAADTTEPNDIAPPDIFLDPCRHPITSVGDLWILQREPTRVVVSGGSGNIAHTLIEAPSGATFDPQTGDYVAGDIVGAVDRISTEDLDCGGIVETRIHVVAPMEVRPTTITMAPGAAFTPVVSGGSGQWHLEILLGGTNGGKLLPASPEQSALQRFRAGASEGDERLAVVDDRTGQFIIVPVIVVVGAEPAFDPQHLLLPVGNTWPVGVAGGSGFRTDIIASPIDGPVRVETTAAGARWVADDAGIASATTNDAFLGDAMTQYVRAFDPVGIGPAQIERHGRQAELWTALGPGDIDGDTFADAIIGAAEMTLSLPVSGGVFIWRGGTDGMAAAPVRTIAGIQRNEQFGAALATGDFDGDGRGDLVIGSPRFSTTLSAVGRVLVYAGIDGAFYANDPVFGATGQRANDLFGHAVAACDFNGDGYDDLAVGAYDNDDVSVSPAIANRGVVELFAGGPEGLGAVPFQTLFGQVPDGANAFIATTDLRFGRVLGAADFNGDGACDLVASSWTPDADNGVVWAYRGVNDGSGLVAPLPARVWRGTRAGRLGHALVAGDLDRDGLPELVVTQPRWSKTATQSDNHGALRIMRGGGEWLDGVATETLDESAFDATILNPGSGSADTNDEYGFRLALGDVTGDGHADLVVGGIADEVACTGCVANTGAVFVLAGVDGAMPSATPVATMTSGVASDRVGSAVAVVGSVDNSGQAGVLVAVGRDDSLGADVGRSYVYKPMLTATATGSVRVGLDMPSLTFGYRVAQSLDMVPDIDGDGLPELVVGAPNASGPAVTGARSPAWGLATVHRGTVDGFEAQPFQTFSGFRRHSAADTWGTDVAGLRDFDGDGRPDVAVLARAEDAATSYGTDTLSTAACNVARTDVGAVAVFGGRADGRFDDQPMLMHFGVQVSQTMDVLAHADFNGDGLTDVMVGSRNWDRPTMATSDNAGGFEIVLGRARAHATSTAIVCEPAYRFAGYGAADTMATAVVGLGDIDGDGCEEVAVGVPLSDLVASNAGYVEIFFGAGAACHRAEVRRLVIAGSVANAGVGASLFANDIDNDGLSELAIGSTIHRVGGIVTGAAWVVRGETLAELAPEAAARADDVAAEPLWLFGVGAIASAEIPGMWQNGQFGLGVALLPGHEASPLGPNPLIAVASLTSVVGGQSTTGSVRLYPIDISATGMRIGRRPIAGLAGEAHGSLPTARMQARMLPDGGGRLLVVGASESSVIAPFSGAALPIAIDAGDWP